MKKTTRTANRLATLSAIAILLLTATSALGAEPVCSQATLNGTYVTSGSGTLSAGSTGSASMASVGKVTYDGRGNGQAKYTQSAGGVTQRGTGTGTYTVNSDCTGSKNFGGAGGVDYDFVVTADGREIVWIITNSGMVVSGRAIRLDNSRN